MPASERPAQAAPAPAAPASLTPWWRHGRALERFLADLLSAEIRALRPGESAPPPEAFAQGGPADARLGEGGLGLDSLERLALGAALGEALFLHRGGLDDALVASDRLADWHEAARLALERFSSSLRFRTSGSTGRPRACAHALSSLEQEAAFLAGLLPGRTRIVAAIPCHHVYGFLFTLLLPARLGLPVLDARGRLPGAVAGLLQPGDLVVGHPGFWSALARAAPEGWPGDVLGACSGAPCPGEVWGAVAGAGLGRLVEVYGASETGGIGWRCEPSEPFRLMPFWRQAGGGSLLREGAAEPVRPPDRLRWQAPGRFRLAGRRDRMVQVGGTNVSPARVRAVLRSHPAVRDAAVRLMSRREGDRLKAFVVPADPSAGLDTLRAQLGRHAETRLGTAERPRAFSFGPCLSRTPAGKPADWPLPADHSAPDA